MLDIKVVDGSFSTQLSTHVKEKIDDHPLWTSRFLVSDPEAIFLTHLDYLRAGADIIQTATYQASIAGFVKYLGLTEEQSIDLIKSAVSQVKKAISHYLKEIEDNPNIKNRNILIAGSCGPYGAALHDGSEYTGTYGDIVSKEVMAKWHRPRIETLINAGVDLLALETIPCATEAEALVDLLREFPNIKAWMSFSCRRDGRSLADGNSFEETARNCYNKALPGQLVAVGVNCIAPNFVTPLLESVNGKDKKERIPLIVYPNSGEKYVNSEWEKDKEQEQPIETFVHQWLDLGVTYIGSCCRLYSKDLVKIKKEVDEWQKKAMLMDQ